MPTLLITITCLFKKEDRVLLQADERRAVVEDAIKKVLPKFKLQAISICGTKTTLRITHSSRMRLILVVLLLLLLSVIGTTTSTHPAKYYSRSNR
jgi:hypothetical protein